MDIPQRKIASLHTTCWAMSAGGEHYTGTVSWRVGKKYNNVVMDYVLGAKEAAKLNKKDRQTLFVSPWRVGEKCTRFFSVDALVDQAVALCKETPEIGMLVKEDAAQPTTVYYCDGAAADRLRVIGDQFEKLYDETDDPWRKYPTMCRELDAEWSSLLQESNLTPY